MSILKASSLRTGFLILFAWATILGNSTAFADPIDTDLEKFHQLYDFRILRTELSSIIRFCSQNFHRSVSIDYGHGKFEPRTVSPLFTLANFANQLTLRTLIIDFEKSTPTPKNRHYFYQELVNGLATGNRWTEISYFIAELKKLEWHEASDLLVRRVWFVLIKKQNLTTLEQMHQTQTLADREFSLLLEEAIEFILLEQNNPNGLHLAKKIFRTIISFYNDFSLPEQPRPGTPLKQTLTFKKRNVVNEILSIIGPRYFDTENPKFLFIVDHLQAIVSEIKAVPLVVVNEPRHVDSEKKRPERDEKEAEIASEPTVLKKSKVSWASKAIEDSEIKTIKGIARLIQLKSSDELIMASIQQCKDSTHCMINNEPIPTALLMIQRDRFELFRKFLSFKPEACLLDLEIDPGVTVRDAILETLLKKGKIDEISYLLSDATFYGSLQNKLKLFKALVLTAPELQTSNETLLQIMEKNGVFDENYPISKAKDGISFIKEVLSFLIQNRNFDLLKAIMNHRGFLDLDTAKELAVFYYNASIENPNQEDMSLFWIRSQFFDPNEV